MARCCCGVLSCALASPPPPYGLGEGLLLVPRLVVANLIAVLAARRALALHGAPGQREWDKPRHIFPKELGA